MYVQEDFPKVTCMDSLKELDRVVVVLQMAGEIPADGPCGCTGELMA